MRTLLLTAILFSALFAITRADCRTKVIVGTVDVGGVGNTTYIAQSGGNDGNVTVNGNIVATRHNRRFYIAQKCDNAFEPSIFLGLKLLGKTLAYTVDLSSVGCACNAALYLVKMPAINQQGFPDTTKCGDYYCDANNVCGIYCPEMDVMEANNRAFQVTPHKCDPKTAKGHYNNCDGGGCGMSSRSLGNDAYGPGGSYEIDTTKPIDVTTQFSTDGSGNLNKITTNIVQGSKHLTMVHDDSNCHSGYLESMTEAFQAGMVLTISYWGDTASTMSWLDIPPCTYSENCNVDTSVTFSNIKVY